ncbi:hypothetical protein [Pandoraea sp. NPDC090278]|uniref:hypothetical protein n=1 Tax=Pandoraea sp. NPDC090278 TaxID=3364391 RepID=UPI00383B5197
MEMGPVNPPLVYQSPTSAVTEDEATPPSLDTALFDHVQGKNVVMVLGDIGQRRAERELLDVMSAAVSSKFLAASNKEFVVLTGEEREGGQLASKLAEAFRCGECVNIGFDRDASADERENHINAAHLTILGEQSGNERPDLFSDVLLTANSINRGAIGQVLVVYGADSPSVASSVLKEAKRGTNIILIADTPPDGGYGDNGSIFSDLHAELKRIASGPSSNIHIIISGLCGDPKTSQECALDEDVIATITYNLEGLAVAITAGDIRRAKLTSVTLVPKCLAPNNLNDAKVKAEDVSSGQSLDTPPSLQSQALH